MARTIRTKATPAQVQKLVRDLPAILRGRKPNRFRLYTIFWGAVAHSLFTDIHRGYEDKSEGDQDELGNTWDKLDEKYVAYKRPVYPGEIPPSLRRRLKDQNTLGLLTPTQYAAWKQIFGVIYGSYRAKMGEDAAKALAGQIAWTKIKEQGGKTKLEVLGSRDVPIMRVTDRLIKSISPGDFTKTGGYRKRNRDQVFELQKGTLTIGTKVPYADKHDKTRPVWPNNIELWINRAIEAGRDAVMNRLQEISENGALQTIQV